jgi:hypothetical protein
MFHCASLLFILDALNIHGLAIQPMPRKHTWIANRRFWRPHGSADNLRHRGNDVSMKVTGATKPDVSDKGTGGW